MFTQDKMQQSGLLISRKLSFCKCKLQHDRNVQWQTHSSPYSIHVLSTYHNSSLSWIRSVMSVMAVRARASALSLNSSRSRVHQQDCQLPSWTNTACLLWSWRKDSVSIRISLICFCSDTLAVQLMGFAINIIE